MARRLLQLLRNLTDNAAVFQNIQCKRKCREEMKGDRRKLKSVIRIVSIYSK